MNVITLKSCVLSSKKPFVWQTEYSKQSFLVSKPLKSCLVFKRLVVKDLFATIRYIHKIDKFEDFGQEF